MCHLLSYTGHTCVPSPNAEANVFLAPVTSSAQSVGSFHADVNVFRSVFCSFSAAADMMCCAKAV